MDFYHVRVSIRGRNRDEVKNNMMLDELEDTFLAGYRSTRGVTLNGSHFPPDQIERVRVSRSSEPAGHLIADLKEEDRRSPVVAIGGPSYEWRAAARAADVTDQFITGPPGEGDSESPMNDALPASGSTIDGPGSKDTVFLIYGRDSEASHAVKDFLRSLGLRVIEWDHVVARVGVPNPYVGDVVAEGLRMADVAVVLLTPDDVVSLRSDLLWDVDDDNEREFRGQPRPNVIYEAGFADALGRERTLFVEVGPVKSFSDIFGRLVIRYDGSSSIRHTFSERLRIAGLNVDKGGTDWLTRGDVTGSIKTSVEMIRNYNNSGTGGIDE